MAKKKGKGTEDDLTSAKPTDSCSNESGETYDVGYGKPPVHTASSRDDREIRKDAQKTSARAISLQTFETSSCAISLSATVTGHSIFHPSWCLCGPFSPLPLGETFERV